MRPKTKPLAFSVHLLTGSGAALALMALVAATKGEWRLMFGWLGIALIVDGIDGPLARKVDTKKNASNWDGTILDLVIDYLTYVFIPAYALIYTGLLPWHLGLMAALVIALTGAMYFADVRMKADDNCFVGFPAVWQMPLLVFLVFDPPVWATLAIIGALALAQYTWLKFIHPMRTARWRPLNLTVTILWVILAGWSIWEAFDPPGPVKAGLLVTSLWLLLVGVVMQAFPERPRAPLSAE
ncbi:CDP-alcohol phosphatidyltransferase family protein [Amaricoccus sp.]|uniref:CDP-alcohol phosphatidyltransferase family protein n=1 Tax=Amaricoccus sp. TaxID=1872485 RepID=UPI001B684833|nr:CDP-alcohol phosphatidyltransferase family protein [Amaricoccus sp.]MBP7002494.1 phosphatidylcholine synthase [Amaricoccus sp.]